jgi:hypothetical protein
MMIRDIEEAVAQLRREPEQPVLVEVDGLIVELRLHGSREASQADLLASIRAHRWRAPLGTPDSATLLREDRSR